MASLSSLGHNRKIVARRAVYYQIHLKKADFYQIINRNQLFYIA
ncbi:Hypothetical protein SaO217_0582 [Staphylococcus aureus]|nr:Hypothetical protein SaO217_0582 [Staphylococcus aureus]